MSGRGIVKTILWMGVETVETAEGRAGIEGRVLDIQRGGIGLEGGRRSGSGRRIVMVMVGGGCKRERRGVWRKSMDVRAGLGRGVTFVVAC